MSNGAQNSPLMNITCSAKVAPNQRSQVSTPTLKKRASTHAEVVGLSSFDLQRNSTQVVAGLRSGSRQSPRVSDYSMTTLAGVTESKCAAKRVMDTWAMFSMAKTLETLSINGGASTPSRCDLRPAPCTNNRHSCDRTRDSVVLDLH